VNERGRRVALVAVAGALVFAAVAAVIGAVWPDQPRRDARAALWLFGFRTVRVSLHDPSQREFLSTVGFGEVTGAAGRVFMYDADSGRFGVIDAATNRVTQLPRVPSAFPPGLPASPTIAAAGAHGWLVTGPGRIGAFATARGTRGPPHKLPGDAFGATRVVAADGAGIAVYATGATLRAARVDPTGIVGVQRVVRGVRPAELIDVVADGRRVWLLTRSTATLLDARDLRETRRVDLRRAAPSGVAAAVAPPGKLWVIPRAHAALVDVDVATGAPVATLPYLATDFPYRVPTQLVASGSEVFLLAPTRPEPDRHDAEVLEIAASDMHVRQRINAPSSVFIGGIAVT